LLRSYEGIFDFPVTISESRLAQLTGLNASTVLAQLQQLTRLGIIEYQPQKDKPQITLLLNRMYADSFRINLTNHLQRKAHYISRLSAIKAYINDTSNCRGKIIGNYFGDDDISNCGICDTCIQQKNTHITASDVEEISTAIITIITKEPIGTPALLPRLKKWPQQKIWEVINYLQAEEKITISSTGIFSIKH
jgi:ATP-dependent DNA helicase RecQ